LDNPSNPFQPQDVVKRSIWTFTDALMFTPLLDWLDASPRRWHLFNVIQAALLRALAGPVFTIIAIAVLAGLAFLSWKAGLARLRNLQTVHTYDVVLAVMPQTTALTVAAIGLWLTTLPGMKLPGLAIFTFHAVIAAWWACDLESPERMEVAAPRRMEGL
jgi:hypothetical protein